MILKAVEIRSLRKNHDGTFDVQMKKSRNGFRFFTTDWKNIPRYNKNGEQITPEEFERSITDKYGKLYFLQNYGCQFIGSSDTLIDPEVLKTLYVDDPLEVRDQKLRIYRYPEAGHKYQLTVDPAKDGHDAFAIQVIDITNITFEQVACAKLQVDYLSMVEYLEDYGKLYNNAYIIVENNEGAGQSIADFLNNTYNYDNLYFDIRHIPNSIVTKKKPFPGFRTTTKTRRLILNNLKMFMDNRHFILHDSDTIKELFTFINVHGKYQADAGYHDDMVMALALTFAPFTEARNFIDVKKLIEALNSDDESEDDTLDIMDIGSFDDFTDDYRLDIEYQVHDELDMADEDFF